jgi:hypothetical protein
MHFIRLFCALSFSLFTWASLAQIEQAPPGEDNTLVTIDKTLAIEAQRNPQPRDLTVLTQTLSAEQLDRAVLNRLMQELHSDPESSKARLALSDNQLEGVFITLSNARGFINGSEMANVHAMCSAWEESTAEGDERIAEAIAAYSAREQRTQSFIAKYYGIVLLEIESLLSEQSLPLFRAYMDDRRRRLANAGMTSWGSPVQNISAGADSIKFHCR